MQKWIQIYLNPGDGVSKKYFNAIKTKLGLDDDKMQTLLNILDIYIEELVFQFEYISDKVSIVNKHSSDFFTLLNATNKLINSEFKVLDSSSFNTLNPNNLHFSQLYSDNILSFLLHKYWIYKIWTRFLTSKKFAFLGQDNQGEGRKFLDVFKNVIGTPEYLNAYNTLKINQDEEISWGEFFDNLDTSNSQIAIISDTNQLNNFITSNAQQDRYNCMNLSSEAAINNFESMIDQFMINHDNIYYTTIDYKNNEGVIIYQIYIIYQKNPSTQQIEKILFWNLFANSSQLSLPFKKEMLFPNILKTMEEDESGIFENLVNILKNNDTNFQKLITYQNSLIKKPTKGPSLSVEEIDYYKTKLSSPVNIFRELGTIKPYFISAEDKYNNYKYSKLTFDEVKPEYKKYAHSNLLPKYPSINYFSLKHQDEVYNKKDDYLDNEYHCYTDNKIINLIPEFDIEYRTTDVTTFDIQDYIDEFIEKTYKSILNDVNKENEPTVYTKRLKDIQKMYKLENTTIDTELVNDNEYQTVYKLKIKLK